MSNFDQFFVGLPISVYKRPYRTSPGPPSNRRCGPLGAGIPLPATQASQPANIGLRRLRLIQEAYMTILRLIAVASALALATSAQAMSPAPLHQADGMLTQIRSNCGAGMRWNEALGRCATTAARRNVRRGVITGN